MKRGVAGIVTDGGFRDAAEIARLSIPAFHQRPSAPTNLTLHQAVDTNVPISCGDAPVWPGDVIVGDADGCIVIPAHLADEIADEAVEMTAFEVLSPKRCTRAARSWGSIRRPIRARRWISRSGARRRGGEAVEPLATSPLARFTPDEARERARDDPDRDAGLAAAAEERRFDPVAEQPSGKPCE